ncbi:MAG: hypothetical protein V3575_06265 [Candidatus Absconditabacteria bacterium]
MKKYIFLTFEGFTQQPDGTEVENVQMLGVGEGIDSKQAFENIKQQNEWLIESSFDEIYCHELVNNDFEFYYLKS